MKAVKDECQGKTVVIVSHRDSSFEFADKVYRVEVRMYWPAVIYT